LTKIIPFRGYYLLKLSSIYTHIVENKELLKINLEPNFSDVKLITSHIFLANISVNMIENDSCIKAKGQKELIKVSLSM